ncbi:MAG: M23 family metallopeptidase [Syntrophobacterales bacterium]|jgi:murein DD-endopeptidase MepM/ murein hydrolase activator NlpD|nr:M23 family metallopeptidase [Syntrophobacterales bacterium]
MHKNWKQRWGRTLGYLFWGAAGLGLIVILLWMAAGHLDFDDPTVGLKTPVDSVGAKTDVTVVAADQSSGLKKVKVTFSQGEQSKVLLDRSFPPGGTRGETVEIPVTLEPKALGFKEGKAKLTVEAWDRSWSHLFRGHTASLTREVVIDLVPVTLSFQAVSHLLHAGGTGVMAYRLNKEVKESGVRVGDRFFQGFPNPKGTKGDYVVLFPVPQEGAAAFQVELLARPSVGQEVKQAVSLKAKPRKWRHDSLNLPDNFLRKVASTLPVPNPSDLLGSYLEVNRNLRAKNHATYRKLGLQSNPQPLWSGAFQRFYGKPMARFGDRRTYLYQGKAVDQQTHLGEDLASLVNSPVYAGNNGVVVFADDLGIYGKTVILDHGLGVFSSYSHMSKIDAKVGDKVQKGATLGLTGTTGLAAGDHLHFAINLQGEFVDPLEWWDPHWLRDQVEGVWGQAGAPAPAAAAAEGGEKKAKGKKKPRRAKGKKKTN